LTEQGRTGIRDAFGVPLIVEGRADEVFRYGKVTIDPLVIRTVMAMTLNAIEYQVSQTGRGIDVAVVTDGAFDRAALASSLEHSLRTAGFPDQHVHVRGVAEIDRHRETGKTRRFVGLRAAEAPCPTARPVPGHASSPSAWPSNQVKLAVLDPLHESRPCLVANRQFWSWHVL
jgi:hypothetical protein